MESHKHEFLPKAEICGWQSVKCFMLFSMQICALSHHRNNFLKNVFYHNWIAVVFCHFLKSNSGQLVSHLKSTEFCGQLQLLVFGWSAHLTFGSSSLLWNIQCQNKKLRVCLLNFNCVHCRTVVHNAGSSICLCVKDIQVCCTAMSNYHNLLLLDIK